MNKKIIAFVIALMGFSLVGIIGFQLFWINHALKVKDEMFNQSVSEALHDVVEKLETHEAMDVISEQMKTIRLAHSSTPLPSEQSATVTVKASQVPPSAEAAGEPKSTKPFLMPAADSLIILDILEKRVNSRLEQTKQVRKQTSDKVVKWQPGTRIYTSAPLDSTFIDRIIRLTNTIDTARLHDKLSRSLIQMKLDSGKAFIFRFDTVRRAIPNRVIINKGPKKEEPYCCPKLANPGYPHSNPELTASTKPLGVTTSFIRLQENLEPLANMQLENAEYIRVKHKHENITVATSFVPSPQILSPPEPIVDKQNVQAKANKLTDVIQKMAEEYVCKEVPIEERVSAALLDSLLKNELRQRGITLLFEFAVINSQANGILPVHTAQFKSQFINSKYRVKLFPNDIYARSNYLTLHFHGQSQQVFKSLGYMMGFSILFTCIIVSTFLVTTYTILKQKKISEIKNDFINNMTHEFKTPLATISLAIDSINNPKVLDNKDRIRHYTSIIRDENKRMNNQVESVLQMAMLEKEQLKLDYKLVNMHELICQAVQHMNLHLEPRQGRITAELQANYPEVWGDEAHLGNIICNLLDNANKYSPVQPEIIICTQNTPAGLLLSVADKGLGMSKDTQKRIFNKFFRVSTGNIHNVKGFGLGLSYVKAIMLAHKGQIAVSSELGKGSRFELLFPSPKNI